MTNEQLVARVQAGENEKENMFALWQQNRWFIHKIAMRYRGKAELDDLDQEGYLALYEAIEGYREETGNKFLTFASYYIQRRMIRYIQNTGTTVRIPVHEHEKLREYKALINSFRTNLGKKPSEYEIATQLGISIKQVRELEKASMMVYVGSLDRPLTDDENSDSIGDMVADNVDIEEQTITNIDNLMLQNTLWQAVDRLPIEQSEVIKLRYKENMTRKDTGERVGINKDCVRTLEEKAIYALRHSPNASRLRTFLPESAKIYSAAIRGTGIDRFNSTWTSATERVAISLLPEK